MVQPPSSFTSGGGGAGSIGGSGSSGSIGSLATCPHPPAQVTFNLGQGNAWNFATQVLNIDIKTFFELACECIAVATENTDNPTYVLQCIEGVMTRVLQQVYAENPITGTGTSGDPLALNLDLTTNNGDNPLTINEEGLYLDPKFFAALLCQCIPVAQEDPALPTYSIQCLADGTMVRVLETVDTFVTFSQNQDGSVTFISNTTQQQLTILPDTNISWNVDGDEITLIDPDGPTVVVSATPDDDTWISFNQNVDGSWIFVSPDGLNSMTIPPHVVDTDTRIEFTGNAAAGWTFTDPVTNQTMTIPPAPSDSFVTFSGNATDGWTFLPAGNSGGAPMTIPPFPAASSPSTMALQGTTEAGTRIIRHTAGDSTIFDFCDGFDALVPNDILPTPVDISRMLVSNVSFAGKTFTMERVAEHTVLAVSGESSQGQIPGPYTLDMLVSQVSGSILNVTGRDAWVLWILSWSNTFERILASQAQPWMFWYEYQLNGGGFNYGSAAGGDFHVNAFGQGSDISYDGFSFGLVDYLAAGGVSVVDMHKRMATDIGANAVDLISGPSRLTGLLVTA